MCECHCSHHLLSPTQLQKLASINTPAPTVGPTITRKPTVAPVEQAAAFPPRAASFGQQPSLQSVDFAPKDTTEVPNSDAADPPRRPNTDFQSEMSSTNEQKGPQVQVAGKVGLGAIIGSSIVIVACIAYFGHLQCKKYNSSGASDPKGLVSPVTVRTTSSSPSPRGQRGYCKFFNEDSIDECFVDEKDELSGGESKEEDVLGVDVMPAESNPTGTEAILRRLTDILENEDTQRQEAGTLGIRSRID